MKTTGDRSVWIGFDPREATAFGVARYSIRRHLTQPLPINGLVLSDLQERGLYTRPIERRNGQMFDVVSNAPMSTEFAVSRFFLPFILTPGTWALFVDCDILARASIARLFEQADSDYAVQVVKHEHKPDSMIKMDGQIQTTYRRKNWSSVMLVNSAHPAHERLTIEMLNETPGRDLHAFCWLKDEEIGALDVSWNYLVGSSPPDVNPNIVHFTEGMPYLPGYQAVPYADEWRAELKAWAMGGG